jgi:hypothetical protein
MISVIASEAKQSRAAYDALDCFVAEPVIGLAEGETRWLLAMTIKFNSSSFSAKFSERSCEE